MVMKTVRLYLNPSEGKFLGINGNIYNIGQQGIL